MSTTQWPEVVADEQLARWIAVLRLAPPVPLDLKVLRRPRPSSPGPPVAFVKDLRVPGGPQVAVRVYRPGAGPRPVVVHVHGGGFVAGDLDSHDRACRRIANSAGAVVVAVDHAERPSIPDPRP